MARGSRCIERLLLVRVIEIDRKANKVTGQPPRTCIEHITRWPRG